MFWHAIQGSVFFLQLAAAASGYGTTVSIPLNLSYCPATPITTTGLSRTISLSADPSETPYFLYIVPPVGNQPCLRDIETSAGQLEYLAEQGALTTDITLAGLVILTPQRQLMSGDMFFSTAGSDTFAIFEPHKFISAISRAFEVIDETLIWTNGAFSGQQARFCVSGSMLNAVFSGELPAGCTDVTVKATPAIDTPPTSSASSVSSSEMAKLPGMGSSGPGSISLPSTSTPLSATLSTSNPISPFPFPTSSGAPNCLDRSPFDGTVNEGYLILCDTDLSGVELMTANGASLVDCIAACSSYMPLQSPAKCVAVEYDIAANSMPCHLKSSIGVVNPGGNASAQAAIVVNQPDLPSILFSSSGIPHSSIDLPPTSASSTSTEKPSSVALNLATTMTTVMPPAASTGASVPPTSGLLIPDTSSTSASIIPSTVAYTPQSSPPGNSVTGTTTNTNAILTPVVISSTTTASVMAANTAAAATALSSTIRSSSSSSMLLLLPTTTENNSSTAQAISSISSGVLSMTRPSTTAMTAPTSTAATPSGSVCTMISSPGSSLCPEYNHQSANTGGACYEVECSTTLLGTIIPAANTTSSLSNCLSLCNLYNLALPYSCLGVNYYNDLQQNNCLFMAGITGITFNPDVDSGRLLYAGYPSITDSPFGASSSATQATSTLSTTTTPATTTTAIPTTTSYVPVSCAPAPSYATLCPGASGQCYQYNNFGTPDNFEMECATQFTGTTLQPYVAFSVQDCIQFCQYDNVNEAANCVGIVFLEGLIQNPPINNCFPYSSITGDIRGNFSYNAARLLYSAYPSITDYGSATPSP